ncbi:BLUF domain-containing protein [Flavilitoribacter nigricans]|uniref:BLUF domain-containing protein n=1 Tax=Flavilitoribacter nigricans (strain ATCC 23147 / DSM 23189 / NBRC 102662 / NCIMB 1420 / SS-2) TaxID=1122177 RepID=A0A2D0N7R5_FLAN2|nr:BLUF domain-containing protein [Flavilitoribacter nigricans]PHN04562.1 hypothetical protein CRP01_21395 [Flavilitoribacter nigricans DSM 23189 = NBRC 102662]
MDNLSGLVYTSNALISFDAKKLEELAEQAAKKNRSMQITGYLYYENKKFLQYIEGPPEQLEALMESIEQDPRHEIVYVLQTDDVEERRFPDWDMQWLSKPMVVSIRMENILASFISMIKNETVQPSEENFNKVWDMVDRISRFKHLV